MMMHILNVVELLEKHSQAAEKVCGFQFVQACLTAARYLVEQGERIVDLEQELTMTKLEREYNRSRADFFREVAEVGNQFNSVEGFKAFSGYQLEDLARVATLIKKCDVKPEEIKRLSDNIIVLYGAIMKGIKKK